MTALPGLGIELPASWSAATLAEVTSKIGSGATPRGGSSVYVASGPALIRSQNIHDHEFKSEGLVFLSQEAAWSLRGVAVEAGDVLINITGDSILRAAIAPEAVLPARVNQHVAIVRSNGLVDPGFLQKWLSLPLMKEYMLGYSSGGTRKAITKGHLQAFPIPLPPIEEQHAIAATLGALDDKIESNRRVRGNLRALGSARFQQMLDQGAQDLALKDLTLSIARGVSPKYADEDPTAPVVINQKCIRDGWVSLGPARRMHNRNVTMDKRASDGDILVNSTGVGTLGRVARWHRGDVFIDSHVSVVKPDAKTIDPVILAYALLGRQEDIEALATGSTGQTELSPARLGSLGVSIPSGDSAELAEELLALEELADQMASEIGRLTSLRDALLPELLSGRIRVPVTEVAA